MTNGELIDQSEVIDALANGYEVLYINRTKSSRPGTILCMQLTKAVFSDIVNMSENAGNNEYFIKTSLLLNQEGDNNNEE